MEGYKYKVRVSCLTFNHAAYIKDAMNGFCMQETTFPFVCTILDDCSTDGEQEVIKKYLQEHFNLEDSSVVRNEETDDYILTFAQHNTNINCYFAVYFLKYNHYSVKKTKKPYLEEWSNTKYVAMCEGDDYWLDSQKLALQVKCMEKHPLAGLCYTKAIVFNQLEQKFEKKSIGLDCGECAFESLLQKDVIPTLTVLYRYSARGGYEECIGTKHWKMGDYPLWLYIALKNDVVFINSISSVYRRLPESASHSTDYYKRRDFITSVLDVKIFFASKIKKKNIESYYHSYYQNLFNLAFFHKKYSDANSYFKMYKNHTVIELFKYFFSLVNTKFSF